MASLTEQQIAALAPNENALSNGRGISRSGDFSQLGRSADGTFYQGECRGSGSKPYITSADFSEGATPVLRCTCPSRQHPCKHCLALLFEILEGKPFAEMEIPQDILKKRARRGGKAAETADADGGGKETKKTAAKKTGKKSAASAAAQEKKLRTQLEGLDKLETLVLGIMDRGLGSLTGETLETCRKLSKELENHYLPGPRRLIRRLVLDAEAREARGDDQANARMLGTLEKLWALIRKSRQYLEEKLAGGVVERDASPLFEELGGVWKFSELEELGLIRENVRLLQLAFWVRQDDAREEFVDTACWADLDKGDIVMTYGYRPFALKKRLKEEDSTFGVAHAPKIVCYPGEGNPRVRWESADIQPVSEADRQRLRELAAPALAPEVKAAKDLLKNPLFEPPLFRLLRFARIGKVGESFVLVDPQGDTILLEDMPGLEGGISSELAGSTAWLPLLPDAALWEDQSLLGAIWHDAAAGRMKMQPLSIVTDTAIARLLY